MLGYRFNAALVAVNLLQDKDTEAIMSNIQTTIKFDGPAVDGKTMDVALLAPSLPGIERSG